MYVETNCSYPKARAVMAQAMSDKAAAAARLSFLQALIWLPPASFETIPTTAASMANVRKNIVAPFPPKPVQQQQTLIKKQHFFFPQFLF